MSNKQVPNVYRQVMNHVVENVRPDFDEVGVDEAVLNELLRSWETKMAMSRTADWSNDPRVGHIGKSFPPAPTPAPAPAAPPKKDEDPTSTTADGAVKKEEDGTTAPAPAAAPAPSSPPTATPSAVNPDDDEINSDLDDDDDDLDDEDEADMDLVVALYEKVHRVKNKWKVTLKDGLISVGGKEYLFAKCTGEFEF